MFNRVITFFSLIILFVAVLLVNNGSLKADTLDETGNLPYTNDPSFDRKKSALEDISVKPGKELDEEFNYTSKDFDHCKSVVFKALESLPSEHVSDLQDLTLYFSKEGRRGYAGGDQMIIRCNDVSDIELTSVVVHELGHVVDTGMLNGSKGSGRSSFEDGIFPVFNNDLSTIYYSISWETSYKHKDTASGLDFVSGYASTDPFEDFAEAYNYYVLHGTEFRKLASKNDALRQKYDFMKKFIFEGKEYYYSSTSIVEHTRRDYDATLLPYDYDKFVGFTKF